LRVILDEDVANHEPPATDSALSTDETPASQGSAEGASDGPFASSSAPGPDDLDADAAREKLRSEAIAWGIPEAEIIHILGHHELSKAHTLLWRARKPSGTVAAAAD
jgi:hypothetical protein